MIYVVVLLLVNYLGFRIDKLIKTMQALMLRNVTLMKQMLTKNLQTTIE